jgi:dihydrofolate reductase
MAIIGIVAIAKNYAIGKGGRLPWHYPADLKFFKETTTGNAVVMGANTWRSIGRPLPNRLNVVLSGSNSVTPPSEVMRLSSKDEVLDLARYLNRDLYIMGGAQVYAEFADVIQKWFVTIVPIEIEEADVFLPREFLDRFEMVETRELEDDLKVKVMLPKKI